MNVTLSSRSNASTPARDGIVVVGFIASVLLVSGLPYLFGYLTAPPGKRFMGIVLNVPDTAQYFSWAREFSHAWFIENKLTPEPGDAVFFNLYWLLVGRLASAAHVGIPETTQLVRLLSGALYLWAIYWFAGFFLRDPLHRWTGFLVVSLGGGLGWLLVVAKQFTGEMAFPLDLYVNEANTFLTVMAFPHQAAATGLLVLILGLSAVAFERQDFRAALVAGVLGLILGIQHGYDLLVVYGVVGVTALVLLLCPGSRARLLGLTAAICVPSAPAALYLYYITGQSPIWRGVLAQYGNAGVYTPTPPHLLVLMGLPLLLVLSSRPSRFDPRRAPVAEVLLRTWLLVGFLLLYIPTDFQIKMLAGWQLPVGILATRTAFEWSAPAVRTLWDVGHQRNAWFPGFLLVMAVLPVNGYLFAWRFVDLGRHDYPYYLHIDEVDALDWLGRNSDPSDVVLSSLTIGQYVPGTAGNRSFLGHWAQTLDFYRKRELVTRFFGQDMPETERLGLVRSFGIRYVLYGGQEKGLGDQNLTSFPWAREAYAKGSLTIFRIETAGTEVRDHAPGR